MFGSKIFIKGATTNSKALKLAKGKCAIAVSEKIIMSRIGRCPVCRGIKNNIS